MRYLIRLVTPKGSADSLGHSWALLGPRGHSRTPLGAILEPVQVQGMCHAIQRLASDKYRGFRDRYFRLSEEPLARESRV